MGLKQRRNRSRAQLGAKGGSRRWPAADNDDDNDDSDDASDDNADGKASAGSSGWGLIAAMGLVSLTCLSATGFVLHRAFPEALPQLAAQVLRPVAAAAAAVGSTAASGAAGGGSPFPGIPQEDLQHLPPRLKELFAAGRYSAELVGSAGIGRFHPGLQFNHNLRQSVRSLAQDSTAAALGKAFESDAADPELAEAAREAAESGQWFMPAAGSGVAAMLLSSPGESMDRSKPPSRQTARASVHATTSGFATSRLGSDRDELPPPVPTDPYEAHGARCTVEFVSNMTAERFLTEYQYRKPVIFPAAAFRAKSVTDAINSQWRRSELLQKHCGYTVKVSTPKQFSEAKGATTTRLCDYIRSMDERDLQKFVFEQGNGQRPTEASDDAAWSRLPLGELLRRYVPPPFIDYGVNHGITIGGSGTGTPFHFHGDGWNEVVVGLKRWFMFDLRKKPALARTGRQVLQTVPDYNPSLPPLSWFRTMYSSMDPAVREGMYECVQGPNEVLYVPEGFLHATLNIGDTVAIAGQHLVNEQSLTYRTVTADRQQRANGNHATHEQRMEIVHQRISIVQDGPGSDKLRKRLVEALMNAKLLIDALDQALYTVTAVNQLYGPMYKILFSKPGLCLPFLDPVFYASRSMEIAHRAKTCREAELFAARQGFIDGQNVHRAGPSTKAQTGGA